MERRNIKFVHSFKNKFYTEILLNCSVKNYNYTSLDDTED